MRDLRPLVVILATTLLAGCWGDGSPREPPVLASYTGEGTTYYVDHDRGRDSNAGTNRKRPWRTLAPVRDGDLGGGDTVRLRGGETFTAGLELSQENLSGTSRRRMLSISSYGSGRATLVGPDGSDAISASNVAGIHISHVNLRGRGDLALMADGARACRDGPSGIRVVAHALSGTLDQGVVIDHANVSRFCEGINISSEDDESHISHVRVRAVSAHDNGDAGVFTHDAALAQHAIHDVRVTRARAYRNLNRGGIVLFGVDRGRVTHSTAFGNAKRGGGGVGIWAFDSNRIRIAWNESYRNGRRALANDGDGFDLDRGVSNSVMEHNYSHDNGGIGFLVCSCEQQNPFYRMHNVVVRSNVSSNDGSSGQPSLYVLGGEPMRSIRIESNRVESLRGNGPLVSVGTVARPYKGVRLLDNNFAAAHGKALLQLDGPRRPPALIAAHNRWRICRTGTGGHIEGESNCRTEPQARVLRSALSSPK